MRAKPTSQDDEVRITVDGAQFYSFVRAMKRSHRGSELGDVVMTVAECKLTIESQRGGTVLTCNDAPPVVARLSGGRFCHLASLVTDAKATGPLMIVFRPAFGQVSLPLICTKAKFDPRAEK